MYSSIKITRKLANNCHHFFRTLEINQKYAAIQEKFIQEKKINLCKNKQINGILNYSHLLISVSMVPLNPTAIKTSTLAATVGGKTRFELHVYSLPENYHNLTSLSIFDPSLKDPTCTRNTAFIRSDSKLTQSEESSLRMLIKTN